MTVTNPTDQLTVSGHISGTGTAALNLYGAGTLVLAGSNSFSGATNVTAGTLNVAHPLAVQNSTVNLAGAVTFAAGITSPVFGGLAGGGDLQLATAAGEPVTLNVGGSGRSTTFGGVLSGLGGLSKQGTGTLTLTTSNTYAGPTAVAGGVLRLQPLGIGSIGIHFIGTSGNGAFTGSGGVVPMSNWNSESGYSFSGTTLANNFGANSGATFSFSGASNSWATGSVNELLNGYVASTNNPMTFTVSGIPFSRYSMFVYVGDSTVGNQEEATIHGATYYYATEGGTPVAYTAITNTSSASYQTGNYIEVDGLTGTSQDVRMQGTTQPYSGLCDVEIVNTSTTVGNNILPATTRLSIASGGTLDVCGNNQQFASLSDSVSGSGGSIINSSSTSTALTVAPSGGTTTFSGTIQGGGSLGSISLVLNGSGTQILGGSNTYVGPTTINGGELLVNGSWVSPVTVNSGGTLGGTGILSSVAVNAGGHLAPGDAPGLLTLSGSLSLLSGANMDCELDTPADSDEVYMPTGFLSLNGQQFSDFNFTPLGGFAPGRYTLIDAGSVSGNLGGNANGTIDGFPASLAVQGNDLVLTVVPEPRTWVLLAASAVGMVFFVPTRRKSAR